MKDYSIVIVIILIVLVIPILKDWLFVKLIYKVHTKRKSKAFEYRRKMFLCSVLSALIGFFVMFVVRHILDPGICDQTTYVLQALGASIVGDPLTSLLGFWVALVCNFLLTRFIAFSKDPEISGKEKTILTIIACALNAPYTFLFSPMVLFNQTIFCD